ncbi:lipopolysaccharide heptosyltransferase II [soil metagenome]
MKILVLGPSWVGDMVMTQALFALLKQRQPNAIIDVLAPEWSRPLLARMPEVRNALTLPLQHGELQLKKRFQLGRQLQSENYDQAIVIPNTFKAALIPFWATIPKRTGWRGEMRWGVLNDLRVLDTKQLPQIVQRFMALGIPADEVLPEILPQPKLHITPAIRAETLAKFALNTDKPILALCPGAEYGPSKRWPPAYFAQVALAKLAEGWQVWLFGAAKEQALTAAIQQASRSTCIDLCGRTSLAEAIDLLSCANAVVSNDSGLMHMAAALNRPLIALYGATDPNFAPPLTQRAKSLSLSLSCSPCAKRICPLGHMKCLNNLRPDWVLSSLNELLAADI